MEVTFTYCQDIQLSFSMWTDAFRTIHAKPQTLEGRLIAGQIAIRGKSANIVDPTVNADAALAAFAHRASSPIDLALVHPEPTPANAIRVLMAVAFSELLIRNPSDHPSKGHSGILYITQNIVQTREHLASVQVKNQSINDVFKISSPRDTPTVSWRNLLVSNPARALQGFVNSERLRAIIIDASHPRTLAHLPELLQSPKLKRIPLRIVIAPPHESLFTNSSDRLVWLWDPETAKKTYHLFAPKSQILPEWETRTYWLTPQVNLANSLERAESLLLEAARLAAGRATTEVMEAWHLLTIERGLCVPLEQAERSWRNSRMGVRLRDRLDLLRKAIPDSHGALKTFLDMHWTSILDELENGYDILRNQSAPQKLLSLIDTLNEFAERPDLPLRIITLTEEEAPLLAACLADLDNTFLPRVDSGAVEIVHQHEEARRIAAGNLRTTILITARSNRFRYLDLFPSRPIHLVAYPHEATRDRKRLEYAYQRWAAWANGQREHVGKRLKLQFTPGKKEITWKPPTMEMRGETAQVSQEVVETHTAELDLTWLGDEEMLHEQVIRVRDHVEGVESGRTRLIDIDGILMELNNRQTVDVYRPETDLLLRVAPNQILRGDFLVMLVDDRYEALFDRLCYVAALKRPPIHTLRLERWNIAKNRVLREHDGNRQAIFRSLQGRISVGYAAVKDWFGADHDEDGTCIGPRERTDFDQLAILSGIYSSETEMSAAFSSIQNERVNRRRLGRMLRSAIRGLARRHAFTHASNTADVLDTEVEEVMHALELREIATIVSAS